MQTLADVLRRIVAAENGLLLPKDSFTRANVVVEDGARSYERFILESGSANSIRCDAARALGASVVKSTMRR